MRKESWLRRFFQKVKAFFARMFGWVKRAFTGNRIDFKTEESRIESPSKLVREAFFRRKTAVVALVLLVGLFLFVFIAPSFVAFDVNYTDPLQQNVAPSYSLRSVPKKLQSKVAYIDGFSDFTVGVATDGKLYVWGNTENRLNGTDFKEIPESVRKHGVCFASAGKDHIIALTKAGEIVGWGDKSCGQYGVEPVLNALPMPESFRGYVEPSAVKQLLCGYQASALVFHTGEVCVWGNTNAVRNLSEFVGRTDATKVAFTNSALVALLKDGTISTGRETIFTSAVSSRLGNTTLDRALQGERIVELASTGKCIALLSESGTLIVSGAFENGENDLPSLQDGEKFVALDGGTRHFVGITDRGNVYAWGHNAYGQCNIHGKFSDGKVYAGSLQTYVVDGNQLKDSIGLKGYLMGTDGRGRDVFARIVHGGKTTMTIGAVAVLVSSFIAILVGCISGYFGGWIDTLLMRITEIFSSIPFLPFAMLLSQIIKYYNVSETTRILIIMLILGALSWTGLARMIRGQVLAEREKEFVTAAKAIGVKEHKIAFRHVLPNVVSVIFVSMTLDFAGCLLTESSLSYLGFGVQQPRPTWGNMLNGCNNSTIIQKYWWQWLFPALFLSLAVVCINVIGDAMRDALDPKNDRG